MWSRRADERAPLLLVAGAIAFGLVELWPETRPVAYLNDEAFHIEMVRFAAQRIREGHDPLTSWFSPINLGSPVYLHYQSLPSIITALFSLGVGAAHAFEWSVYLLLSFWPAMVYLGARLFGLPRWAAAGAAAMAPLLTSAPGVGYQWGSYLWIGWGVWTQLWAMFVMPLAWGFTYQAITRRRRFGAAMFFDGLVVCLHYLSGYMMVLPIIVVPLVAIGTRRFWPMCRRALMVGAGGVLVSSWVVFPVFFMRSWAARNEFLEGTTAANSYGASRILSWLVEGDLFDQGRVPIVTGLVFVGLVVCVLRARADLTSRVFLGLFILALVAFFGRPTLGPVLDLVPGAGDLFLRRFLSGVQLAGLLLAGVGALAVTRTAVAAFRSLSEALFSERGALLVPARHLGTTLTLAALCVAGLYPAWHQLAGYAERDGRDIVLQRRADQGEGVDVDKLLAIAVRRGGGRVFGGTTGSQIGDENAVGGVGLYIWFADQDVDAVGFTLRSASLMSDPEAHFAFASAADYAIFAVRWLILSIGARPPVRARLVATAGEHSLWSVASTIPGTSYLQVVDTQGSIAENRLDIGSRSAAFVDSPLAGRAIYPTVAWDGAKAPHDTLHPGAAPRSPPGRVLKVAVDLTDGSARAEVDASRRAVVLLKVSFDPGWHVEVDGRPARTEMVAPALVGVEVSPGRHVVRFFYVGYSWYPLFFASTGITLVLLLILPVLGRRVGRAPRRRVVFRRSSPLVVPEKFGHA